MLVTLALAWEGHEPDETIEVDDIVARRLLHDGFARAAETEPAPEGDSITPPSGAEQ